MKNYYKDIKITDRLNEDLNRIDHNFILSDDLFCNCYADEVPLYKEIWESLPEHFKGNIRNISQALSLFCYYSSMNELDTRFDDEQDADDILSESCEFDDDLLFGSPAYGAYNDFSHLRENLNTFSTRYSADEIINDIKMKFGPAYGISIVLNSYGKNNLEIIIGKSYLNHKENKRLLSGILAKYGWVIVQFNKVRYSDNVLKLHPEYRLKDEYKIMCEPIETPEFATEEIKSNNRFLYHITTEGNLKSIMKRGLIPINDRNADVKFPKPRVYFTDSTVLDDDIQKRFVSILKHHHHSDYFPVRFVILVIDVKSLPADVRFYYDTHNSNYYGVVTEDAIPSECIIDVIKLDECSNENAFQRFINGLPAVLRNLLTR